VRTSPRDALLADSSEKKKLGRSFGYSRAMDTLGSVFGMLAAAGTVIASGSAAAVALTRPLYQRLILMVSIPALLTLPLIAFFVRENAPQTGNPRTLNLSLSGFDWRFRTFLAIMVVFTLGNSSDAFLMLKAQKAGLDIVQIFLMLAMWKGVTSVLSIPAGIVSDRIGRNRVIRAGWLVYALVYLGFGLGNADVADLGAVRLVRRVLRNDGRRRKRAGRGPGAAGGEAGHGLWPVQRRRRGQCPAGQPHCGAAVAAHQPQRSVLLRVRAGIHRHARPDGADAGVRPHSCSA